VWGLSRVRDVLRRVPRVLELLVLLANIYDEEAQLLLIDEPEQHLHPQYQAFVLDELQRSGKAAVIATHSPSFLNVKTLSDLHNVICLQPDFGMPSRYRPDARVDVEVQEVLPRMTEQHRAFFFAKLPVFVEGYFDATVVGAIQRALGLSAEAAGSCLIPSLGKDDAGRYLMLGNALGKRAVFLFDLDALFDRRLSQGANQNDDLAKRVADAGHGKYDELVGKLQQSLTVAVKKLEEASALPPGLEDLCQFLITNAGSDNLDKRRIATLVALETQATEIQHLIAADEIRGRLRAVLDHLASVDVHVLPGGALENYLPSYTGNRFKVPDDAKRPVALAEQAWLATNPGPAAVAQRYKELATIVRKLPSRPQVDLRQTLERELAHLLHHLIMSIRAAQVQNSDHVASVLGEDWRRVSNFVQLDELEIRSTADFSGSLVVLDKFGIGEHVCRFDQRTQSNDPQAIALEKREVATEKVS
jgi:hypothetical protein